MFKFFCHFWLMQRFRKLWIPAFAGMTEKQLDYRMIIFKIVFIKRL
ncbi:Uncharacterized protein dnm_074040 [Desulfonema magnum]|uniref:Uncharacterized protein n=1 Tax=Desulfonema magnum TaxID=45655 RepID=A0A975BT68_9BACT|nr:Uncharacterized protein dnm_074040 [Desulfonema magnum]